MINNTFESYIPDNFCKEFYELRGHSDRIVLYMAVALEFKPLLDDWIHPSILQDFIRICENKYGMYVKLGSMWDKPANDELLENIPGGKTLTTTKFIGGKYYPGITSGHVHVFVSKSKDSLERGFRCGWYPLVINNMVINKPEIDYIWFGHELGYPDCCIDFFSKENHKREFLHSILRNTNGELDYRCNCLTKNTPYSYIFHMPCSYNCAKTIDYVKELKREIKKHEPRFVRETNAHLRKPFLVFEEQFSYAFEGKAVQNRISYSNNFFLGKDRFVPGNPYDLHGDELKKADQIEVNDNDIHLFKKGKMTGTIQKKAVGKGFILSF